MAAPVPILHGDYNRLKGEARAFVEENIKTCTPDNIWLCDGSDEEFATLIGNMKKEGQIRDLPKYKNCYIVQTDPADVARVESKTVIVTEKKEDAVPTVKEGCKSQDLGIWMSPAEWEKAFAERFPGCMKGRTMYIMPFSMGPIGGPLSKIGIELTDSKYVVLCMRIMTRMGQNVLEVLGNGQFVRCLHSIGCPLPTERKINNNWPCNPEKVLVAHFPAKYEVKSFGSGYGGNSLLGKKCFALRIGMVLARDEGWFAEHMLISRIEMPNGKFKYITAAFPSACGKTNLAMLTPTIPGYKVTCVGDDICWMRFDDQGVLRAINPEAGFFGVAPGTSMDSNPMAMATIMTNTVFTNTATTSDGGVWWEGLPLPEPGVTITDWRGQPWTPDCGRLAAHPNSRFTTPAKQCPIIDPDWENPKGVPIDAIIFGGRRPEGVPLIYESFSWQHGVFVGATARSETTAAAQDASVKVVRNDPFAMKPFFGYNFGKYLAHWLSFAKKPNLKLPKIYHVNWFRKDAQTGKFLWPGYGENGRVLDWVCRRLEGEDSAVKSQVGYLPKPGAINIEGLKPTPDMEQLLSVPKEFWIKESESLKEFLEEQAPKDIPDEIRKEADDLIARCKAA